MGQIVEALTSCPFPFPFRYLALSFVDQAPYSCSYTLDSASSVVTAGTKITIDITFAAPIITNKVVPIAPRHQDPH